MVGSKNKTVAIKGGLGNQLFQYAFAKFLYKNFDISVQLDISWYKQQSLRKFELNKFIIDNSFKIIDRPITFLNKITSYRSEKLFIKLLKKNYLPPTNYFNGYWQDNFFAKYLTFSNDFNKDILKKIIDDEYYVIHLRKGDFAKSVVHYILPNDYYKSYIDLFKDKKIYVLSPIKKDALKFIKDMNLDASYVDTNEETAFNIIFNSSGGIASNSTYCWWAINMSNCKNWIMPFQWLRNINIFDHNLSIRNTIVK
jgi:hypothetical protein